MNDYLKSLNRKRNGAGAIFRDEKGRVLLLKPSYKKHWTIPGGAIEKDESPRAGCEREVEEEIGLKKGMKKLILVDYLSAKGDFDENFQWLFDGGKLSDSEISRIKVDGKEIVDYKFSAFKDAKKLLGPKLGKRLEVYVQIILSGCQAYLEDGLEVFQD